MFGGLGENFLKDLNEKALNNLSGGLEHFIKNGTLIHQGSDASYYLLLSRDLRVIGSLKIEADEKAGKEFVEKSIISSFNEKDLNELESEPDIVEFVENFLDELVKSCSGISELYKYCIFFRGELIFADSSNIRDKIIEVQDKFE